MPETVTARRILIVDDDPLISRLLGQSLSLKGFTCQVCSSGEEALALLAHEAFDVAISDLRMPGISGLELLERAHTKYPRTAFLMATGEDDIRVGVAAMKKGAEDYLVKPFLLDGVLASSNSRTTKQQATHGASQTIAWRWRVPSALKARRWITLPAAPTFTTSERSEFQTRSCSSRAS
jgi:DNA-binding NtrC family response regulator